MGGAERSVRLLAEALVRRNHEVVVVSTGPMLGTHRKSVAGVEVYYVGIRNLYCRSHPEYGVE
jgi:hypothetical protein